VNHFEPTFLSIRFAMTCLFSVYELSTVHCQGLFFFFVFLQVCYEISRDFLTPKLRLPLCSIQTTVVCVMSVRIPVRRPARPEPLGPHWGDFNEILCLGMFRKPVEKIKSSVKIRVPLKSDRITGIFFTCRSIYIFDHIWLNSS
jgi:hypothetical protein